MTIEHQIAELTQALKENTAALREILSVGAATAADTLVPAPAKKRAAKAEPLRVIADEMPSAEPECPAPVAEETPEEKGGSDLDIHPAEEDCGGTVEAAPQVPDLPVPELRNSLKEVIKGKLLADTEGQIKQTFDALRAKYGVSVIKELTDDQVAPFYAEVLSWG
jgi:hypothetical protein